MEKAFQNHFTINCQGRLLDLSKPKVMGILNVTPDSFFDGGKYTEETNILRRVGQMLLEGADIIDIGGMSSRPGAEIISPEEELNRVAPAISKIKKTFDKAIISIDTVHSLVAKEAVNLGASLVNDISAGSIDDKMLETVGNLSVPYILMHMKGAPKDMQDNPEYEDLIGEQLDYFSQKIFDCKEAGIREIIIDPGFGFGKSIEHNFSLLKNLEQFQFMACPILVGISRKSMLYKLLDIEATEALNASSIAHLLSLQNGANILRVHDVKEAKEVIKIWEYYSNA